MSWDWSSGAGLGVSGAEAGAQFGPFGAAIGGAAGLAAGGLFGGSKPSYVPSQLSALSDQEWNYYQNNILPLQQQQLQSVLAPNAGAKAEAQAQKDVDTQFANIGAATQRQLSGLGIAPTAAATAATNKSAALGKGIAEAGAMNSALQATAAQRNAILGA